MKNTKRILIALSILGAGFFAFSQEPEKKPTAADEMKKDRVEQITKADAPSIGVKTVTGAMANPIAGVANLATGLVSLEIKKAILRSDWQMTMTQKFAASAIGSHLSDRDKVKWTLTNYKYDGKVILILNRTGMTKTIADETIKQEPLIKWRKCGWDYLIFSNDDVESWAFSTDGK